ncbi:MAG: hypothetical protein LBL28_00840 [Treponema sp.]|nr:hypothetical protein [Treponema sp.]
MIFFCGSLFLFAAEEEAPAAETPGGEAERPALELDVDSLRRRMEHEANAELASLKLGDSDVSLQVSGYWKGTLSGNWGLSRTPLGTAASSPDSPILFRQEADLTLSLWVRDRWFVEASFLDDYNLNTYRAGYQGLPGEAVQYVGLGNTGLGFPNFPYLDLGGDSPSSFGAYGHFGGGPLSVHTLIRYDLAAQEERIFVGNRERSFLYTPLNQALRGRSFVLPDDNLDSPPRVYLEDEKGDLRDGNRRRWRLAASSEYAAGAVPGLVELSVSPKGLVAVAYSKGRNDRPWDSSLGSYPGGDFLKDVQDWFGTEISLKDYPQPGAETANPEKPGAVLINGVPALVVYEPGTFSPFERMNRYSAASSNTSSASLVRLSTGDRVSGYELLPLEDSAVSTDIPLYALKETRLGIYELSGEGFSRDRRNPENRWPLGNSHPQIYLPGSGHFTGDLGVRFTNYSSAGAYSIGTDVVPGSVRVWRSGLEDPHITYNPTSGVVSLENPAGFSEVVRITYLKRSEERRSGSLAAGLGAVYAPEGPFRTDLALGMRWNFTGETYAENGVLNPGTVGLGVKTSWDYDRLKARITGGFGFEQPDTSGLYRIAGMEGHELYLPLPPETSFISEAPGFSPSSFFSGLTLNNRSDLSYRNYRDTSILGNSSLMSIDWGGATLVSGQNGPYPVRDSSLTSQTHVLAAEFTLDNQKTWAGFEVPLGSDSALMEQAREIEIPFRFYGFTTTPPTDFTLILQIGALSARDLGYVENPALIVERQLYPNSVPANFHMNPQIAKITLTDEDRRKLQGANFIRLFAVHTGPGEIQGRVLLAPPIIRGLGFRPLVARGTNITGAGDFGGTNEVRALEIRETSDQLENKYGDMLNRLHGEGSRQRVLELSWKSMSAGSSAGADGRISGIPLSSYQKLGFFVKMPANAGDPAYETLRFILARGPESFARQGEISLDVEIPFRTSAGPSFRPGEWSKVEIVYRGGKREILVEGRPVEGARLTYRGGEAGAAGTRGEENSGYLAILINPGGNTLPVGTLLFDEVFLEEPSPAYRLNGGGSVEWKRPEALIQYQGKAVLSDISLATALESGLRGNPFIPEPEGTGGVSSRSSGEAVLLGARIKGNVSFTAADNIFYWNGGHDISRSWGPFSVNESFSTAPEDKTMDHRFDLGLSGMFNTRLNGEVYYEDEKLERKWNAALGFSPPRNYIPALALEAGAVWIENTQAPWIQQYGKTWAQSWGPMIPDLGAGAANRNIRGLFKITEKTSPLGLELTLEGNSAFSLLNNRTQSTSLARIDIPLTLRSSNVNFRGERVFKRHLLFSGQDARDDGQKFAESIGDSLPLWGVFPLYSLFAPELGKALDEGLLNSPSAALGEYTSFTDRFGLTLQLPPLYNLWAFAVPVSASLQINRILEQKLDTRLDVLNLGGNLGFSAINMFGSFGTLPLFPFYMGDEFTHTLETSVAVPRNETLSWRCQSSMAGSFHGFSGGILDFTNTITTGSAGWTESFILDWTVPTRKSLLSVFYNWLSGRAQTQSSWLVLADLMNSNYEQFRTETLELTFDHTGDYLQWSLIAGHESIIRILGRLYFSVFGKLNTTQNERTQVLSFIGTVGTTLNVSF